MEINELKGTLASITAPDQLSSTIVKDMDRSSHFMDQLKTSDARTKAVMKRFYISYFIIAACYFGFFILNPDPELTFGERVNGSLLFLGILLFAVMGKMKYAELKRVRYDEPSNMFLEKAYRRYRFWTREMSYGLVFVVLINIGSCRSYVSHYPHFESTILNVLAFEIVFFSMVGIGLSIGYQHWSAHKKPVADELRLLLDDSTSMAS